MDIPHQPVKDADVTVNADVYILRVATVREVLLKVLHVCDENATVTLEVLVPLLALIADMDDNLIARGGARPIEKGRCRACRLTGGTVSGNGVRDNSIIT